MRSANLVFVAVTGLTAKGRLAVLSERVPAVTLAAGLYPDVRSPLDGGAVGRAGSRREVGRHHLLVVVQTNSIVAVVVGVDVVVDVLLSLLVCVRYRGPLAISRSHGGM